MPLWSRERNERHPLVIAGGSAIFLNPEPIADFVDVFLIGEAEEMLPEFLAVLESARRRELSRAALLEEAASVPGAYVPRFYEPVYEGPRLVGMSGAHAERRILRRLIDDLDRFPTTTQILAEDVAFGDMFLVEASRGCQWGCRFCAAGFMARTTSCAACRAARRSGWSARRWPASRESPTFAKPSPTRADGHRRPR